MQPLDDLRLQEEAAFSTATGLSAPPAPQRGGRAPWGHRLPLRKSSPQGFPELLPREGRRQGCGTPPSCQVLPDTREGTRLPNACGAGPSRAPHSAPRIQLAALSPSPARLRGLPQAGRESRQRWRGATSILLPLPEHRAQCQRGAGGGTEFTQRCRAPPAAPTPLQGTPQALLGHPPAPRLPLSLWAAAEQCGGPGAPSPAREAPSPPTAKSLSWGRGQSLQPGPPATFPRENLTLPSQPTNPARLSPAEGLAALKCFLISGFLQSLTALQRGQTRHKAAENKGNIYRLLPEAACAPGRAQAAPPAPRSPPGPHSCCSSPRPLPPAPGVPGDRDPRLQTAPAQAGPGVDSGQGAHPPQLPGPVRPGHLWLPAPPELGAHGASRNVLEGSVSLPANKRSKLGGAEPAGGIWQLTCHFVRHWSKLISLAESP